jgi:hypothetical protein
MWNKLAVSEQDQMACICEHSNEISSNGFCGRYITITINEFLELSIIHILNRIKRFGN